LFEGDLKVVTKSYQAVLNANLAIKVAAVATLIAVWGCGSPVETSNGEKFLLAAEPGGAVDVLALRADAKDQDEVVVIGRIGGRRDPWIKGTAAFPIVDRSAKACSEIEGDTCPTPWDYCCEPNLADKTVLVMFTDETGKPIKEDARELLSVKELQTVVVKGKAKRDKEGNLTVLASQLRVRPDQQAKE
jgi:hypothetical protein